MFRGSKPSDISPKNFGAGSIIEGSPGDRWLVVNYGDNSVRLVDLNYFGLLNGSVAVEDPNYLTETQARELVRLIDDCYTFSDYELVPEGLKEIRDSRARK